MGRMPRHHVDRLVRPPARPHRVLDAGRRDQDRRPGGGGQPRRPARRRDHRPRRPVRSGGLLSFRDRGRHHADPGIRALPRPRQPLQPDAHAEGRPLLPPDRACPRRRGLSQPGEAVDPGLDGGPLVQAPHRQGTAGRAPGRPGRAVGMPGWRGQPGPDDGRRAGRPPVTGRLPRHPGRRSLLRGADGPRHRRAACQLAQARQVGGRHGPAHRHHQRQPLHLGRRRPGARRTAVHRDRVTHLRHGPLQVLGARVLRAHRGRDVAPVRHGGPRRLARHAGHRRDVHGHAGVRPRPVAGLPDDGRPVGGRGTPGDGVGRRHPPLRHRPVERGARAHRLRTQRHREHGLPGLLPDRRGPL